MRSPWGDAGRLLPGVERRFLPNHKNEILDFVSGGADGAGMTTLLKHTAGFFSLLVSAYAGMMTGTFLSELYLDWWVL